MCGVLLTEIEPTIVEWFIPKLKENLHHFVVLKSRSDFESFFFFEETALDDCGHVGY